MVDHTQAGVEHSLRWDVLPVRIPGGRQHAKLSVLAWSNHIRVIVASANLTEPGYRKNYEVAATVDLSPKEADRELLAQAMAFLRGLLTFVPRGRESAPEVQRAEVYLAHVERQAEAWARPRGKGPSATAVRLHASGRPTWARRAQQPRGSDCRLPSSRRIALRGLDCLPVFRCRRRQVSVAAALCQSMARGRAREICFCVPAVLDRWRIGRSPSCSAKGHRLNTPQLWRTSVPSRSFRISTRKRIRRPWHAKMLALRGDTYTALLIGSSNFTCAGMGVTSHRNAEANLVTVADRVAFGREAGNLEAIWPQMETVDDLGRC